MEKKEIRVSCYECAKLGVECVAMKIPGLHCFSPIISLEDEKYLHFNKKKVKKSKIGKNI